MIEELINEIWLEYLNETDFEASYNSISYITDCLTRSYYRITKQESYEDSKNRYYRASGRLLHSFILDKLAEKLNAKNFQSSFHRGYRVRTIFRLPRLYKFCF